MHIKSGLLILSLALLALSPAYAENENIYVSKNIQENLPDFLALEIFNDFKESINDYNLNRANPDFFLTLIDNKALASSYSQNIKDITLPKIKQKKNTSFYYIEIGKNHIEFNIELMLKNKYFINGIEKKFNLNQTSTSTSFVEILFSRLLMNSALAEEDENPEFNLQSKNTKTSKMVIATFIALDRSFAKRSILDKIPLTGGTAKLNLKNLVAKIKNYQDLCNNSLNIQTDIQEVSNMPVAPWRALDYGQQIKMLKKLQNAGDPSYMATLAFVMQMSKENDNGSASVDKKNANYLDLDLQAKSCKALLDPMIPKSMITAYASGKNLTEQEQDHPCTKIANLKMCLSTFTTQAVNINNFAARRQKDFPNQGILIDDMPANYPSAGLQK
ncbi:MAG: hypothetical protein Q7U04_04325 [Bacteriovorax sp.]|nr:hypothetical protein [Bacteriovorax sp.]